MLTPIADRRYLIPFRSQLLPAIFTDTKRENFGMFEGRMVCHDYAFSMTILSSRSLTDRLVKVKWHSEGS